MIIGKPEYFFLLLLILPAAAIAVFCYYSGKKALKKLGGEWRFETLGNIFLVKNFFMYGFFILFLAAAVFALTDIRWGEQLTEDDREGYELVLMLDISRSMLADDIQPDRFRVMISEVKGFINAVQGAKFSIVIFKGKASRVIPVTDDIYALTLFLNTVTPGLITAAGSDMEEGINTALKAFTITGKYRAIILFSDGENMNGNPLAAARAAGQAGIPVITVCIGTETGQNVPLGPGDYLRDKNGKLVLSKANPGLLADIAKQSDGKFYSRTEFYAARNELLSIAKHIENDNIQPGLKLEKRTQYELFLSLSLVFLVLSVLIRGIRWKKTV